MKKVVGIAVLFLMAVVGCKDEKPLDELEVVTPKITLDHYKVTLDVIVKKDDNFALYYTTNGTADFSQLPPIWVGVTGANNVQQVVYDLPKDITPSEIRLDFGISKDQDDIVFKKITIEHSDKKFQAEGAKIFDYFKINDAGGTLDTASGTMHVLTVEGKKQSLMFYPIEPALPDELAKLVK